MEAGPIGVAIPTYRRPDLARACVLQWLVQSRTPDIICVHQNGSPESYEWCVEELRGKTEIEWIHTPERIRQHEWYRVPLARLVARGCAVYFWADHDDIFLSKHVETAIADLCHADFRVALRARILYLKSKDYRYVPHMRFTAHAPGGMSSSMAFNRAFAECLVADLEQDQEQTYSDNVVARVTKPRFVCVESSEISTMYVCHEGSETSAGWLKNAFDEKDC